MLVDGVQALVRVRRACTVSGVGGGMSPGGLSVLGGLFSVFSPLVFIVTTQCISQLTFLL